MKTKPTLLVLAAGIGSRYGGLKQLDPLGPHGETIIDFSVFDAMRAGFGKVIFIIRKQIEKDFMAFFDNRYKGKIEIDYVYQELEYLPSGYSVPEGRNKPWGTGHAVLMAKNKINEPFAVINADDFYGPGAYQAVIDFFSKPRESDIPEYALAGYYLSKTLSDYGGVSRGVCQIDENGYLKKIVETHQIHKTHGGYAYPNSDGDLVFLPGDTIVSMNTWAFFPEIFEDFERLFIEFLKENHGSTSAEFYIPSVADHLISTGKAQFKILKVNEQWFGITYQEDRPKVIENLHRLVKQGFYPEPLWG